MILSFSVPDNIRYTPIIKWYKDQTSQERSREFRTIFMTYLETPCDTIEARNNDHISLNIARVVHNDKVEEEDIDFDSKFNLIGRR